MDAVVVLMWIFCAAMATYVGHRRGRVALGLSLGVIGALIGLVAISLVPATEEVKLRRQLARAQAQAELRRLAAEADAAEPTP